MVSRFLVGRTVDVVSKPGAVDCSSKDEDSLLLQGMGFRPTGVGAKWAASWAQRLETSLLFEV
jgi:hypothetical protein